MKPILLSAAGNPENQDRGLVVQDGLRAILCVADGAGGRSGGMEAAMMATEFIRKNSSQMDDAVTCSELLRKMDDMIAQDPIAGETTCAVAVITSTEIFGASVGDSGIWFIPDEGVAHQDLSRSQHRKPFIGTGGAWPAPFHRPMQKGSLLLATDGLLKYTSADQITGICRKYPADLATQHLIELVRYPSGALPDDVTVIVTNL
ncbi:MAG: protein phosphatase 2C domain-containing protein [Chthoniobacteraceae bacterium]